MKLRKLLCLLLSLLMLVSLVACGDKDEDEGGESGGKKTANPETIVEKFMNCFIDADVKVAFDLVSPEMLEFALEDEGMTEEDLDEMVDELNSQLEEMYEYVEEMTGEKLKMTYEIANETDMDEEDLEYIQSVYDEADIEIEAAKVYDVDLIMEIAGESQTETMEVTVVKIDGQWYLEPSSLDSF